MDCGAVPGVGRVRRGGGSDFIARLIAQKLTERFGTQVLVENRPGAGSTLGAEVVVKSAPDGHTILLSAASYTVNPSLYKLSFDPLNDITRWLRASPANSPMHHRATAAMFMWPQNSFSTPRRPIKSGRLRALAVTTPKRIAAAPDVPTVAESGYPAYEVTNWHGLVGPKGMPKDVVERLNREVNEALTSKEVEKLLAADGLEPAGGSPQELATILREEIARWNRVVRQAGLKLE